MYKYVDDYLPKLQEMFPTLSRKDLKRMVEYGWRMFYFYNLRGCDTVITSRKNNYWMYCGNLTDDSVKHFNYYRNKLRKKLRVMYAKKKIQWDGYYYTSLTKEEYDNLTKKKGRPRKNYTFKNKTSFKILDEAKLYFQGPKYIIKYKYNTDMGYSFDKEVLKCTDVEVVFVKDTPDTFKDVMIYDNKYDLL